MLTEKHPDIRTCLTCGKAVKGRSDKKFCDDYCRNIFNNQQRGNTGGYARKINDILRKNRRILEELLPVNADTTKVSRQRLLIKGFEFKYFTNTYSNKKGTVYQFCYEYGYLPIGDDCFLLVRKKDD
jgi:Uncharacterized protein containing a Zn-ribbon (DUF2116)